MLYNKRSFRQLRLAFAFIAGMAITAGLAHTQITAGMLSPQPIEEPVVPVAPSPPGLSEPDASLDSRNPVESNMSELVYAPVMGVTSAG